ncbi:MAG: CHAT domain-containing protein [Calothrix sp. C42_A2020_038]|nr:CHAT domain-containing protein [Calothrix sp. C42_A2020_038]
MNKIRLILALSMLSLSIIGLYTWFPKEPLKAISSTQNTSAPTKSKLPASRLKPEVLKKLLDSKDINSAVIHVELGWKQQYEQYLQTQLPFNRVLEPQQMSQILDQIYRQTGKKSALIYAVPTPNHLELILVAPGTSPVHKRIQAAKREDLVNLVSKFRASIVNPNLPREQYLKTGKELHELLITPLEKNLQAQGINNLIFCLGGGLRTVPLAALHDGEKFLIEKYSLGIIPAFNLLDFQIANITQTQVLAMGASQFQTEPPLPAVPIEISSIISDKWQGKSLLNQEFTPVNLKKQRAAYPFGIVHLATHAELSPGSVEESYIQFWDTKVRLDELKTLELDRPPVQLLVLSACRTAVEDPQAELGFAGLAVQSGAKAAIASLWSVDDAGTLPLMTQFYQKLKAIPIKSEALRQTQIAMLKQRVSLKNNPTIRGSSSLPPEIVANLDSRELSHPFYWAGFTLVGNPW